MADDLLEDFRRTFRLDELTLVDHTHWTVSLRPSQVTVGSMVLSLRRACPSIGEITSAEAGELATVFADIESALAATFAPEKVNYLALMMRDPQVHFHVIPRYAGERTIDGRSFDDAAWPGPSDITASLALDADDLEQLAATLRASLGGDGRT